MHGRTDPGGEASLEHVRAALESRYDVRHLLGRGGMSDVYLADDRRHQRRVAVKVLHAQTAADLGSARFLREIRIAARLQHPHILPLYDSGEADGLLYYVMPFVEGESLGDLLEREGRLSVEDALRITRDVADGLSHAHDQGVIHRDIKPENILLSGGHAVIADFGIARAVEATSDVTKLTNTGQALGTPRFMSPEQALGEETLDARVDIYALGCVLYQMLAGEPPYTGRTAQAIMVRHMLDDAPAIRDVRPSVPRHVETAILKALSKAPADRYATVLEFAAALEPGSAGVGRTPEATGASRRATPDLDPRTVAVLPFANLSGAADAMPFAAGLQDDLLTELSRAPALTVISRTSVQAYRETTKSMLEIGRELGAGTIVEGGVQKAGNRVRLNVQLIDARSDVHLWAERYDRELSTETIFDLQTELAGEIMRQLRTKLKGGEESHEAEPPTGDLEAYRQYSIGRAFFVERSEEALRSAAAHFEKAVERDAGYALAWAGLSMALTMLYDYGHEDAEGTMERAKSAAARALELDPRLAEAHSAVGLTHTATRRVLEAFEAHTRASELRPGYAGAQQWRCWASLLIGDIHTALDAGRRAVRLDPLDPEARGDLACAHLGAGDDEAALREAEITLHHHPEFDWPRWLKGLALFHLGRDDEARETMSGLTEAWSQEWPETVRALDAVRSGDGPEVGAPSESASGSASPFHAGLIHLARGEVGEGIAALRAGLPFGWDGVLYLRYFRSWPLAEARKDPRWPELMADLDRAWGTNKGT